MSSKNLHVAPCLTASGVIKMAMPDRGSEEVIYLPVDLSCSPLPKDYSDRELFKTVLWHNRMESYDRLTEFINFDFSKYDKIIVWHGDVSWELLFLYLMCDITDHEKLYEIDLTQSKELVETVSIRHQKHNPVLKRNWNIYMGEISLEETSHLFRSEKKIENNKCFYYKELWYKWRNIKKNYILNSPSGELKGYSDNFMDKAIFRALKKESNMRKVVNDVFNKQNCYALSYHTIKRRIRELIDMGCISANLFENKE